MKIQTTLGEIFENGNWEKACDVMGWDYYCLRDGKARLDDIETFTQEEAIEIGLIKK